MAAKASEPRSGLEIRPLMLAAMFFIWIWTAFVSLGPGHAWALGIMSEVGASVEVAHLAILVGAIADAALGIGLLFRRWRTAVLNAQVFLMLAYTLLITILLPHYWLDPCGSVTKNLLLIAATLWLIRTEPR